MKSTRTLMLLALCGAALLAGCDRVSTPLAQRADRIIDMGRLNLPNSPYVLHGYRLDNGAQHDHFVYLVEDQNKQLLTGSLTNQSVRSGKSSANLAVNTELAPGVGASSGIELNIQVHCESVEQCQRKLAAMSATR